MASPAAAEDLGQLSGLVFNQAAKRLYASAGMEVIAAVISVVLMAWNIEGDWSLLGGAAVIVLMLIAYGLRLSFQERYDLAETMRRQSVLTNALGWSVDDVLASEWRRRAGQKLRAKVRQNPRKGYFETNAARGERRLAEMTIESAFYTRYRYGKLLPWVTAALVVALALAGAVIVLLSLKATSSGMDAKLVNTLYLLVPLVIGWDLYGWRRRLVGLREGVQAIEQELRRDVGTGSHAAFPLVTEYNCLMVTGFPTLDVMYRRWQAEIEQSWKEAQVTPTSSP